MNRTLVSETLQIHSNRLPASIFLNSIEFLINLLILPIASLNFTICLSTTILHPNLKLLLCSQSLFFTFQALSRAIIIVMGFLFGVGVSFTGDWLCNLMQLISIA